MEKFPINNQKLNPKENLENNQENQGVDFVFEQNPNVFLIGTKEAYTKYVDTIFPNSIMKDIVYHGTASKEIIENFNFEKSNFAHAVFFTKDLNFAKSFAVDEVRNGIVQAQVVDIKNPFNFSKKEDIDSIRPIIEELVKECYESKNTGISFRNDLPQINIAEREIQNPTIDDFIDHYMWRLQNGSWRIIETDRIIDYISQKYDSILINEKCITNVAVFNQNQIFTLGSNTDLESFKDFVHKDKTNI
jgi:hypothetical protein